MLVIIRENAGTNERRQHRFESKDTGIFQCCFCAFVLDHFAFIRKRSGMRASLANCILSGFAPGFMLTHYTEHSNEITVASETGELHID